MTLTTSVRINWPVPAVSLLDTVTTAAGGDPATVRRFIVAPGEPCWSGSPLLADRHRVANLADQGLATLASVQWAEGPVFDHEDQPPALVVLTIDNPYGDGRGPTGGEVQASRILPAVVDWLDRHGVPRDAWWWNRESWGTWHPGTVEVERLNDSGEIETWRPR